MSAVKKAFVPVVTMLQEAIAENANVKVKSIIDDVIAMCSAKSAGGVATASHRDETGTVVAVRCSYFGLWFPLSHVEFGQKEGLATGMNSMCKEGANAFSKAQRDYKKAKEQLLDQVAKGEIAPTDIGTHLETLEAARVAPVAFSVPGMGWETLEECLAQTPEQLDALVEAAKPVETSEPATESAN